jgi:hypothetical protein
MAQSKTITVEQMAARLAVNLINAPRFGALASTRCAASARWKIHQRCVA